MLPSFVFRSPTRIVFGPGRVSETGALAAAIGLRRVLLVSGPGSTARSAGLALARKSLEEQGIAVVAFPKASSDPTVELVEEAARAIADGACDGVVAYGGGSPIDCAKAASLFAAASLLPGANHPGSGYRDFLRGREIFDRPGPPLIAIPTTAGSGSEVSSAAVVTDSGALRKSGLSSDFFFPRVAIVDPGLHASMPADLTAATGMDALTHTAESLLSRNATPLTGVLCAEAAWRIMKALPRAHASGGDLEARADMAYASTVAGIAFSQTGLGMVHGFAHPVGARCGVAHGLANAVLLPWLLEAIAETMPFPMARLAVAMGVGRPGASDADNAAAASNSVRELGAGLGIPRTLSGLGVPASELPGILADAIAYRGRAGSPRAFSDDELRAVLDRAFSG
ncbi:MAG: iron-containing alcohol dehydrogenase [Spirochaetes bacterium]|nr:iron-containing alcohol dehydrogenase [Spirochaetota bacterium]